MSEKVTASVSSDKRKDLHDWWLVNTTAFTFTFLNIATKDWKLSSLTAEIKRKCKNHIPKKIKEKLGLDVNIAKQETQTRNCDNISRRFFLKLLGVCQNY